MLEKRAGRKESGHIQCDCNAHGVYLSIILCRIIARRSVSFFRQTFIHNVRVETLTIDSVMHLFTETLVEMAYVIVPIMAIAFVGALAGNFLQFGFLFTLEPMKFDLKKMDPIKGLKKSFL